MQLHLIILSLIFTFLTGCAGVGVMYSSDPYQKLENARVLFQAEHRPLAANRLINEVIDTCEQSKDRKCLGTAWVVYAQLLSSPSAKKWEEDSGKGQFPENRYEKSIEYFDKAAITFIGIKRYDAATNAYYNQAITYDLMQRKTEACSSYLKSVDTYKQNIAENPNVKPYVPPGFSTYENFISAERERVGCKAQ